MYTLYLIATGINLIGFTFGWPYTEINNKDGGQFYLADCNNYFHGLPWPMPKDIDATRDDIVKLCQTEKIDNKFDTPLYATLLNTKTRIPIYSANRVILLANQTVHRRPSESTWNRVVTGLCNIASLPKFPIFSNLDNVEGTAFEKCRKYQAVSADYHDNHMNIDRGHLSPNHINSRNIEKQLGTFTLANAAPQYSKFNENSWRIFECITEFTIIDFVPGEPVYILTGTYGSALDRYGNPIWLNSNQSAVINKNPVKVPGFYWKAVCYPGNSNGKKPWGYALVEKNLDKLTGANYSDYITLKVFAQKYFLEPPFGDDCMNADFGQFAEVFSVWDKYIEQNCAENKIFIKNHH